MKVIETVCAVEVFVNDLGTITIQQEGWNGSEESLVVIPADRVNAICKALKEAAKEAKGLG
jgi:hypothetical protein